MHSIETRPTYVSYSCTSTMQTPYQHYHYRSIPWVRHIYSTWWSGTARQYTINLPLFLLCDWVTVGMRGHFPPFLLLPFVLVLCIIWFLPLIRFLICICLGQFVLIVVVIVVMSTVTGHLCVWRTSVSFSVNLVFSWECCHRFVHVITVIMVECCCICCCVIVRIMSFRTYCWCWCCCIYYSIIIPLVSSSPPSPCPSSTGIGGSGGRWQDDGGGGFFFFFQYTYCIGGISVAVVAVYCSCVKKICNSTIKVRKIGNHRA